MSAFHGSNWLSLQVFELLLQVRVVLQIEVAAAALHCYSMYLWRQIVRPVLGARDLCMARQDCSTAGREPGLCAAKCPPAEARNADAQHNA